MGTVTKQIFEITDLIRLAESCLKGNYILYDITNLHIYFDMLPYLLLFYIGFYTIYQFLWLR